MRRLKALALPAGLLAIAEIYLRGPGSELESLAPPSLAARAFVDAMGDGTLLRATAETLGAALAGLGIGAGLGLFLGFVTGLWRTAVGATTPLIELLRPIPSVALIPLSMLVYGFGFWMEISIVAFATFWPTLILAQAAAAQVEPRLLQVARVLGLSAAQRLVKIVLPAAVPRLIVALRLAAGFALVVAVTVEIAANPQGLGYLMIVSQQTLRPELMLAALAWVGLVGWSVNLGLAALQRRLAARFGG